MQPIKLLHTADIHIGMENYGRVDPATGINARVMDFLRRLSDIGDYAIEQGVDVFVFAGDAYKTRDPNPTYQREFARRIKRIADAGIPVVMLVGNHDLPAVAKRATSIDIFGTLDVPNVTVGNREELTQIVCRRGQPLQVATAPYPLRSALVSREDQQGKSLNELDGLLQAAMIENIQALAAQARQQPDVPAILVGHFSVNEASHGSEQNIMIGRDAALPRSVLADPTWRYVCFMPSQSILMADGSVKKIDQVRVGDQVTNHTGNADKVTEITSRYYAGSICSISAYYLPTPTLQVTPDHPVLAIRREQLLCPIPSRHARGLVCAINTSRRAYPCNKCKIIGMPHEPRPAYLPAGELRPGDFLCVPLTAQISSPATINVREAVTGINMEQRDGHLRIVVRGQSWDNSVPETIVLNEDFARLCGYFVAEGSLAVRDRHTVAGIQFTFGAHESMYQEDVVQLVRRIFGKNCSISPNKYGRSVTLQVSSRIIGELFRSLFRSDGHGCQATRLPEFMMRLPAPIERQILIGAIRGDGHLGERDKNRRRCVITLATTSENLAWQLWRLALRQGLTPSLHRESRIGPKTPNPMFTLDLYGDDARSMGVEIFDRLLTSPQKTKQLCFRDGDFLYALVRSIETNQYSGAVLNLEVAQSHTYVAGGIAVHNCLGHIHKHQSLNGDYQPPVLYSGSIERIDFGEEHEPKGFVVAEIGDGPTTWQFVHGYKRQARPFVTIKADVRDAADPTAAVVAAIKGRGDLSETVVRVVVKLRQEQEALLVEREITRALEGAYFVAALQKDVERTERQRLGAISVEALTPAELLARYLQVKEVPEERAKVLIQHGEALIGAVDRATSLP